MSTWPTMNCGHITAGVCPACLPQPVPSNYGCPGCGRPYGETVTLNVTVPVEDVMRRVAEIIRDFAAQEPGPVRERLAQIAEVVSPKGGRS